jgi:hypothetical protein
MSVRTLNTTASLLEGIPREKYAEVWCKLNNGEPHELVQGWPANFDTMTRSAKQAFIWPVMSEILNEIGYKECLREWNKDTLPGKEFDEWWGRSGPQ